MFVVLFLFFSQTAQIRPFTVCAVLRDMKFDEASYASFIDLQDKLHQNMCRRRTLVAIGTHDLDTLSPPFTYEALPPKEIKFAPLNQTEAVTADVMMANFEKDLKIRQFLYIIRDSPVYPVFYDSKRTVLSMPPIINGDHSKIKLTTKNVFVELTATDETKANVALNTLVCLFGEYTKEPFVVEQVEVKYPDGRTVFTPSLDNYEMKTTVEYVTSRAGIEKGELTGEQVAKLLDRMCLPTTVGADGNELIVTVPPTRADVLHECDIMEDVAISYGFNNIKRPVPPTHTVGKQLPINRLSDALREELARAGYTEVLTLALCSRDENFTFMNREDDGSAVVLANPKTQEFQVTRTSMLPGLMKTLQHNKSEPVPLRIFEVSDCAVMDAKSDVGASNVRRLAAVYANTSAGFEIIHGLLDRLMLMLNVPHKNSGITDRPTYLVSAGDNPSFFPGRRATITMHKPDGSTVTVGSFGIVHPKVLASFDLTYPCSALELDVAPFL